MEKNEIKKALYRENPVAKFLYYRKGTLYYGTSISIDPMQSIIFSVPADDTGDADFLRDMDAKLLIRYL